VGEGGTFHLEKKTYSSRRRAHDQSQPVSEVPFNVAVPEPQPRVAGLEPDHDERAGLDDLFLDFVVHFFSMGEGGDSVFFPLASKPRPLRASSPRPLPPRSPRLFSPPGRILFDITAVHSHSIKRAIEREEACHLPPLRTAAPAAAAAQKKDKKLNHLDTKLTVTSLASIGSSFVFPAS
jgi:hypothetical protein